jgi:hypothetical protein
MATLSKSAADLSKKLHRAGNATKTANRVAITQAALTGKVITAGLMVASGVTPGKPLSGMRKGRVNVGFTLTGGDEALIQMRGPAHIVNNPTSAHKLVPRGSATGRRRRGGARALTIGNELRASANHPGTRGKHFWEKSEAIMRRKLPEVIGKTHMKAWGKEFTGG